MKRPLVSGDAAASALHPCKRPCLSGDAAGSQWGAMDDLAVHLLKRKTEMQWVYDGHAMVYRNVSYIPILYTVFDDILMAAIRTMHSRGKIEDMDVNIRVDKGYISIHRYDIVLPIQDEGFNPLEDFFQSSIIRNYIVQDPSIFSNFLMRTFDGNGQKCKKVFYDKSGKKKNAKFTECHNKLPCTSVIFYPNLKIFNMDHFEDDIVALMRKRVVDMAILYRDRVKVELDGHVLPSKFPDYVDLYLQTKRKSKRVYHKLNNQWEVCVSLSSNGQFQQFNFADGIASYSGVQLPTIDNVISNIEDHLTRAVKKKRSKAIRQMTIDVKRHLWVFTKLTDLDPEIDDDAIDPKTLKKFLTQVADSFIFKEVLRCALKEVLALELTRMNESIEEIPKFEDATRAGSVESHKCTLIITEGDSAKSLANVGLGVIGRDYYGVFALKGKLLNVRNASLKKILGNEEINNLRKIIGLDYKKEYTDKKDLRYGQILIMTDQDPDGFHIKGLLINFFHFFWPSLLKLPSFLSEFVTPLVKVEDHTGKCQYFYTMPQYKLWEKSMEGTDSSGWSIKYYKGLGTSTLEEGMQYFKDIVKNQKDLQWLDEEDDEAIEIAFSKNQVEQRKIWILKFEPETFLPQSQKTRILDFITKGLILYLVLDVERSIPSMVDGFKKVQRKIMFSAFKKKLSSEMKVAQFAGYVSECSAYHHGEENVAKTIVGMAQDFAGSNNINVLRPNGQFGTRLEGGKDAAGARYIFTELSSITRTIFNENDDILLDYVHEDGQSVEPIWYLPILPMILVNGGEGVSVGWSTKIPSYNPRDIVRNLKHLMQSEPLEEMKPWFRQFHGEVSKITKGSRVTYTTSGIIDVVNDTTLKIRELPINTSLENYENKLKSFMDENDKFIKRYDKMPGINDVEIVLHLHENWENLTQANKVDLLRKLKLITNIRTSNMHLLDSHGKLRKYDSPEQILREFFVLRLAFNQKRKEMLLKKAQDNLKMAKNKIIFIKAVHTKKIDFYRMDQRMLCLELRGLRLETMENQDGAKAQEFIRGYEYLLSMPIGNFTAQMVQGLQAECERQKKNITELESTSAEELWLRDLRDFEKELDILDQKDQAAELQRKIRDVPINEGVTENHRLSFDSLDEILRSPSKDVDVSHLANVPSKHKDDGLSEEQRTDLLSLTAKKWINDGAIEKIFRIFEKTFGNNDKILLLPQGVSTILLWDKHAAKKLALNTYSLVFIPLNDAQVYPHGSDGGLHFSLLVLDNTQEGKHMFRHYDTLGTVNWTVAKAVAKSIKDVLPALAKAELYDANVPLQQDPYNCGVYVLAITEAICQWFVENQKSAHKSRYDSFVMDSIKNPLEVDKKRTKYYKMMVNHLGVQDPVVFGCDENFICVVWEVWELHKKLRKWIRWNH